MQKYRKLIEFSRTVTLHKRLLGKTRGAGASLGALECWPTNVVGEAENPCFFELVAAGEDDDQDEDDDDAAGEEGNGGVEDEDGDGHCQLDQGGKQPLPL